MTINEILKVVKQKEPGDSNEVSQSIYDASNIRKIKEKMQNYLY